jgi:outer membrane protein OmpA-like peptidoglycan-associated protein
MQDKSSETKSTKKKIHHSARFWILIGLIVFGVLFFSMLPVGMHYGIERYLKDQGADQVNLEDVNFNPITGRMTVTDLGIIIGGKKVLGIQEATVVVYWWPLIRKRFVLKRFAIVDTQLTVAQLEDGRWQIGGIIIPQSKEPATPSSWNFSLQEAIAKNCNIKFISSRLKSDLKIEHAKITRLTSWTPQGRARLEFSGQINEGSLKLQVDGSPFANEIMAAGRIQLKDLSLLPFARLLEPHLAKMDGRLGADLNFETRQTSDNALSLLQKGRVNLQQVRTQIGDTDFSNGSLAWDGAIRIDIPQSENSLKISADGQLNESGLAMVLKNANTQIQQGGLDWQGKIDYVQTDAAGVLNLNGALKMRNTNITASGMNVSGETLNWRGVFKFSNPSANTGEHITSDGELKSGSLKLGLPQKKIDFEYGGLDWQGKFDYTRQKAEQAINTDGQMRVIDVKIKSPEVNLVEKELSWKGILQLFAKEETKGQRITADGSLDGSHLMVNLIDRNLKLEHQGLSWKGRLDSGETNDLNSFKAEADLNLKDIEIHHSETNQRLLHADRLDLQAINVEGLNEAKISAVAFKGLSLIAPPEAKESTSAESSLVRMQAVIFKDLVVSQQKHLAIDAIDLRDLKALLRRNPDGKLSAINKWDAIESDIFSSDQSQRPPDGQQVDSDSAAQKNFDQFGLRIGQVEISGNSILRFEDETVNPTYSTDLKILEARLSNLDSRQPEKPAIVKLRISDEENARISLDGTMQLFAEQLSLDWKGNVEALELPSLSPYVIQSTGYRFTGGELHADIPLQINKNQLNGAIDLIMYHPEIKAESRPEEQKGKIRLNMTLDSALRLLRDKQNNVKLNIPISGNVNDPQFSVTDAVNKVLAKTLQKSALSYLKYMLGPYGIGISVAEFAYGQVTKIRLNPILFAPGSDELDEAAIGYLQRVAAIMQEYPEVRVSVCGVATESDRKAMNKDTTTDTLLELAQNRMHIIEDHLIKLNGIEAKRIIACEPKIDSSAAAKPRANLEI